MYIDLIKNISLIIALMTSYNLIVRMSSVDEFWRKTLLGLLFGVIAVIGMEVPVHYSPGIIYDGRSIVLSIAALYGGGITTLISTLIAGIYRLIIGGQGVYAGIATIISSGALGLFLRRYFSFKPDRFNWIQLLATGFLVHVAMLISQLLILPFPSGIEVVKNIWGNVIVFYSLATVLTGFLLSTFEKQIKVETSLKEREETLRQIYNSVGDVLFFLGVEPGSNYRFLSVNNAFLKATGLEEKQVVGKTIDEVISPVSIDLVRSNYEKAIKEKRIVTWEETTPYPEGLKTGIVSIAPIYDDDGNCTHLVGSVHDITDRIKMEEEIKKTVDYTERVIETANVIFVQLDMEGNVLKMNEAASQICGYSKSEIIGKNLFETLVPKDKYPHFWELFQTIAETGKVPKHFENPILTKTGDERYISWSNSVLIEDGTAIGTISFGLDITDRKRAEEELQKLANELELKVAQRTSKLVETNRMLEDFVYSVSHDLRAPLRAIRGFTEILINRHKTSLNEEGKHYLENVYEGSEIMSNLIEDLLRYSRLGKDKLDVQEIDTKSLIHQILKEFKDRIQGAEIVIENTLPVIRGSRTLLWQVFSNLINNALKYRKKDTKHIVRISGKKDNRWAEFYVEDNGIGIPEEYQEKIFNIFQRLHNQDKYSGTGIGLSIVKKSVELMGGSIHLKSTPGEGSIFIFRIPAGGENETL